MKQNYVKLAKEGEYYCYGCRMFHKKDAKPIFKMIGVTTKRPYCEASCARYKKLGTTGGKQKK